MSLWPHAKFVPGFESAAASAVLPRHHCLKSRGDFVSKGLGLGTGPEPKYAKLMALRLPHDAPQLGDALPYHGSVAKDMSLWPHTQIVCGFESGAVSAVLPRHLCLKRREDFVSKGLGLGTGSEP